MTRVCTLLLCVLLVSGVAQAQLTEAVPTTAEVPPGTILTPLPVDPAIIDQSLLAFEPVSAGSLASSSDIKVEISAIEEQILNLAKTKAKDKEILAVAEHEEKVLLENRNYISGLEGTKKNVALGKLHIKWNLNDDVDVLDELNKRIEEATKHHSNLVEILACHDKEYATRKKVLDATKANLDIAKEREKKEAAYALPDEFAAFKREVEGRLTSVEKKADDTAAAVSEIQKELARQSEMVMLLAAMKLSYDEQAAKDELLAKARDYLERHKGDPKAAKKVTETLEKAVTIFTKSKQTPQRSFTITPSYPMSSVPQPHCTGNSCNAPVLTLPKSSGRGRRKG
jgi:hypothetical protein